MNDPQIISMHDYVKYDPKQLRLFTDYDDDAYDEEHISQNISNENNTQDNSESI